MEGIENGKFIKFVVFANAKKNKVIDQSREQLARERSLVRLHLFSSSNMISSDVNFKLFPASLSGNVFERIDMHKEYEHITMRIDSFLK